MEFNFLPAGKECTFTTLEENGTVITPDSFSWYLDEDDTLLATGGTYTPPTSLIGKDIRLVAITQDFTYTYTLPVVEMEANDDTEENDETLQVYLPPNGKIGEAIVPRVEPELPSGASDVYGWFVNGVVVEGANGTTFTPRQGDEGAYVVLQVWRTPAGGTEEDVETSISDPGCKVAGGEQNNDPELDYHALKTAHIRGGDGITLRKHGECVHDGVNCWIAKIDWDGLTNIDDYSEEQQNFHNIRFQGGLNATVANDICYVTGGGGFVYDNSNKESYEIPRRTYVEYNEGEHEENNNGNS